MIVRFMILLLALAISGCSDGGETPAQSQINKNQTNQNQVNKNQAQQPVQYLDRTHRVQNFVIGPQFAPGDIDALEELGVSLVINSRIPDEMKKLPFDQVAALEGAGLSYLPAPLGGKEYPMSPASLDRFTAAVQTAGPDDLVLLHCRSGRRSSLLLAAYLVQEQGMTVEAAKAAVGRPDLAPADIGKLLR